MEAQTSGLPLPLQAYFLLKRSTGAASPATREALARRAFDLAAFAPAQYPLNIGPPDLTAEYLRPHEDMELDRDVIRLDAVEQLAPLNPEVARSLLEQIVPVVAPSSECRTVRFPDTRAYYRRVAKLAKTLFPPEDDGPQRKLAYWTRLIGAAQSSLQIPPLAESALELAADDAELRSMAVSLAAVLERTREGDPAFTAAVSAAELAKRMGALVRRLNERLLPVDDLLAAYRGYLIANAGRRCRSLLFHDRTIGRMPGWAPIPAFNDLVKRLSNADVRRTSTALLIRPEDIRPSVRPTADVPTAPVLSKKVAVDLRIAITTLSDEAPAEQVQTLLGHIENYLSEQQASAPPLVQLVEASHFYRTLLERVSDEGLQRRIAENYASHLAHLWDAEGVGNGPFLCLRKLVGRSWPAKDAETARRRIREGAVRGARGGAAPFLQILTLLSHLKP